ncbi:hypothetical protein EYF80_036011 [Liparis tanakae]|uniref:Uncharacterized protein n=1 Tax=Liparis tanakae TaxID=230148 RepID=A0A4Z2GLS6_9TELE|nr:hypothetical protein EYF80_036011 [Liparis tanakae]
MLFNIFGEQVLLEVCVTSVFIRRLQQPIAPRGGRDSGSHAALPHAHFPWKRRAAARPRELARHCPFFPLKLAAVLNSFFFFFFFRAEPRAAGFSAPVELRREKNLDLSERLVLT